MSKQELHPRTVVLNKMQKIQAKKTRSEALLWLAQTFPRAFDNSESIHPLKHGIMTDILAYEKEAAVAGISKSKLREAVVLFARRIDYLACLKAREMRIDLQGNITAPVTEEEANRAAEKIRKRIEKSIKNARKAFHKSKDEFKSSDVKNTQIEKESDEMNDEFHHQRPPITRSPSVMIKHKTTRAYDPDAVARLKEKLGLSRKNEVEKEV